jgi:hypothetical protein
MAPSGANQAMICPMTDPGALVRMLAEQCWSDDAGVERMRAYVAPDYVHHALP